MSSGMIKESLLCYVAQRAEILALQELGAPTEEPKSHLFSTPQRKESDIKESIAK